MTEATPLADVTKAYRDLSKLHHPDVSGESQIQADLNRAYDIVLAHHSSKALVPAGMKELATLMERSTAILEQNAFAQRRSSEAQEAKQGADELTLQVVRRITRPLQRVKYMVFVFTGFAAAAGWLSGDAIALGISAKVALYAKMLAVMFGAMGGICQFLVDHQKHLVESFTENLGDDEYCIAMLQRFGLQKREFVAQDLLLSARRHPVFIRTLLRGPQLHMNEGDMIRLTLLKGLEHGILERPAGSKRRYKISDEYSDQFHFDD